METFPGESSSQVDAGSKLRDAAIPLLIAAISFLIGLFFIRPNMGEPDSYREALSAFLYIDEGVYASYWDHPLTMYVFVAATRLALAFDWSQTAVLNTLAVLFGSFSVWPFYQLVRRLVNWQTAAFSSTALILSPAFIQFSTYLSHEIVGFAFALWSLFLFERTLAERSRIAATVFGFSFGATWAARPNGAMFIAPPLLALLFHGAGKFRLSDAGKLLMFASLGLLGCLIVVYRPALVTHLASKSGSFLFTYYELGRYARSTTLIALQSLTPALVVLTAAGCGVLVMRRKLFIALFAGVWISTAYLFYIGMYSMHRYFLVLLPPCLLLCFAGADQLDILFAAGQRRFRHVAKAVAVSLLLIAALAPSLPDLLYVRNVNDDAVASREIGKLVGPNLLFTTSSEPMIQYYNRENPPETVYLVTEYSPGKVVMRTDALHLAQERLREGRPVFATGELIRHFQLLGIDATFELVWEYKSLRLFRLTGMEFADGSKIGRGTG